MKEASPPPLPTPVPPPPAQKYTDPSVGLFSLPSISLAALSLVFSSSSPLYFALCCNPLRRLFCSRACTPSFSAQSEFQKALEQSNARQCRVYECLAPDARSFISAAAVVYYPPRNGRMNAASKHPPPPPTPLPCLDTELGSFWKSRPRTSPTSSLLKPSTHTYTYILCLSVCLSSSRFEALLRGSFLLFRVCSRWIPLEVSSLVSVKRGWVDDDNNVDVTFFFVFGSFSRVSLLIGVCRSTWTESVNR